MFAIKNIFNDKEIKQKIYETKKKKEKEFNYFVFHIELIKQILEEKIKTKNYKIKKNLIIIEFNLNNNIIIVKYNKQNNNIFVFHNGQNILEKFDDLKNEIIKIFNSYNLNIS